MPELLLKENGAAYIGREKTIAIGVLEREREKSRERETERERAIMLSGFMKMKAPANKV